MEHGTSLLELLVTLAIGALVLTCTSTGVMAGSRLYASLSSSTEATIMKEKTAAAFGAALRSLDRHRINGAWSISSGAAISKSKHPLARLKGTSMPRDLSDVLSIVETSPLQRGRVTSSLLRDNSVELRACDFSRPSIPSTIRGFLLVGFSGLLHFKADVPPEKQGCIELHGILLDSIFTTHRVPAGSFHILLPLVREYSLFVDRSSQLRLVSHVGSEILENQPIARGISFVRLKNYVDPSGATYFSVTVKPLGGNMSTSAVFVSTTRRELWNEILL